MRGSLSWPMISFWHAYTICGKSVSLTGLITLLQWNKKQLQNKIYISIIRNLCSSYIFAIESLTSVVMKLQHSIMHTALSRPFAADEFFRLFPPVSFLFTKQYKFNVEHESKHKKAKDMSWFCLVVYVPFLVVWPCRKIIKNKRFWKLVHKSAGNKKMDDVKCDFNG